MRIALIRHAIAEDRHEFSKTGNSDEHRPLTAKGQSKMKENAKGIFKVLPDLKHIYTSPLTRAQQTAEILQYMGEKVEIEECSLLKPFTNPSEIIAREAN